MSKPANKTLIGIFVLGAVALVVIAIVILGSGKFFKMTFPAVCYFQGSVGGLNVGAPVVFRGVKIGTVTKVRLGYEAKTSDLQITVFLELEPETIEREKGARRTPKEGLKLLIEKGLRARLESQSFVTGQMQVGLDFYPDKPAKFVGVDPKYLEIPTIPTPLQELAKKLQEIPIDKIVKDISAAVEGINRVVNSPEITKTLQSASLASEETKLLIQEIHAKVGPVLSKIEGAVGDAQKLIQNVNNQVQPISSDVQGTLREAQTLLSEIKANTAALTSSIDGTVKDVQKLVNNVDKQVEPLGASVQKTLTSVEKTSDEAGVTLRQAQQTLVVLEGDMGEDSELMYELKKAVSEMGAAARAIQGLANTLEQQPESVIFGRKKR